MIKNNTFIFVLILTIIILSFIIVTRGIDNIMEKPCNGCGKISFGYPGNVVICHHCGQRIFFENAVSDFLGGQDTIALRRPKQILTLILLFIFTLGIGNIIYVIYSRKKHAARHKIIQEAKL